VSSGSPGDIALLVERLGALVGTERVSQESAIAIHDMLSPVEVCPADEDQLSAVLALADGEGLGVCVAGGATKLDWGNRPRRFDLLVNTRHLRGFSSMDADNLSLSVAAGTRVSEVHTQAQAMDRTLPLDPRQPSSATVGGVTATGDQGARGAGYGGVRDVVLGLRAVLADGSRVKFGGRTMKNVTGYDVTKLFIGSFGVLGVITEITFRLLPRLDKQALMVIPLMSLERGKEIVVQILDSYLQPLALEVVSRDFAVSACAAVPGTTIGATPAGGLVLLAAFAGHRAAVIRSLTEGRDRFGISTPAILEDGQASSAFEALAEADSASTGSRSCLAVRATVPVSEVWGLAEAAVSSARAAELSLSYRISAARGTLDLHVATSVAPTPEAGRPSGSKADLLAAFAGGLRSRATASGGHLVVIRGLTMLPPDFDAWGDPVSPVWLMKRIKDRFDPRGVLNAGRFVGGI
jgi:glycolate oxidase FAD binding subunit